MKFRLLLLLAAAIFLPAALAENPPPQPSTADQARQLERNLPLVQSLVEGSLRLAGADDPLERAEDCGFLAENVVSALQQALEKTDEARARELAEHLRAVLGQGLAANLRAARKQVPAGSTSARQMQALVLRVEQNLGPLEERLAAASSARGGELLQRALQLVREGRDELRQASAVEDMP